jgi:hypothetical protein
MLKRPVETAISNQKFRDRRRVCRREVLTIGLKNRKAGYRLRFRLITLEPQPGVLFSPWSDGTAAKGMQRENIAVIRLYTGDGRTETEQFQEIVRGAYEFPFRSHLGHAS